MIFTSVETSSLPASASLRLRMYSPRVQPHSRENAL